MRYLKIPQQCYARSKDLCLLNDVVFFYQLKMINTHGFFQNNTVVNCISQHTNYAPSTIWNKIKRLQKNHLIIKHSNGYHLSSYDTLFSLLGYDLTHDGNRKGDFKIHKIPFTAIDDIKSWIAYVDVRDNLNAQVNNAYTKLLKDKRYQYTVKPLHCASNEYKKHSLNQIAKSNVRMVDLNQQSKYAYQMAQSNAQGNQHEKMCNPDVTLSLKGICRILSLSNTSCAHHIVQRMKKYNLLDSINRCVFYKVTQMSYQQYVKVADKYILKDGVLYSRLPNKLVLGV